jgi:hypothetical protein
MLRLWMSSDQFAQLLSAADATSARPRVSSERLARVVRRRHARRVFVARTAVAACCAVVVAVGLMTTERGLSPASHPHELAQLEASARHHALVADVLMQRERSASARSTPQAITDPSLWLQRERAEAALALVRSADRLFAANNDRTAAANAYRQAIQLFPETPAAQLASQRLGRIST